MRIDKTINGEKFPFYCQLIPNTMTATVRYFQSDEPIIAKISDDFIEANLKTIPEYLDWNERVNGRDGVGIVTKYDDDFEKDPDDDFIDFGALVRNVAHDIYDTGSPFEKDAN